jgi:hypothetical protein
MVLTLRKRMQTFHYTTGLRRKHADLKFSSGNQTVPIMIVALAVVLSRWTTSALGMWTGNVLNTPRVHLY